MCLAGEEKEYTTKYKLELKQIDETKTNGTLYVNLFFKKGTILKFGDVLKISGNIKMLDKARNYGGFNNYEYGKITSNLGNIQVEKYTCIRQEYTVENVAFSVRCSIENKINTFLPESSSSILLGVLIGEKQNISNNDIENFRNSSLIHMLCVSRSTCIIYFIRLANSSF